MSHSGNSLRVRWRLSYDNAGAPGTKSQIRVQPLIEITISTIEAEGHVVRFLPPYSPDFNPIELTFSVLKAWLQRNYVWTRSSFKKFGDYLVWAIGHSRCDRSAREQFRHAAGGIYLEEGEIERFRAWLQDWERGAIDTEVETGFYVEVTEALV
jgi:transposase